MSETLTLSAETRDRAGKGASRALRREGRTPAVIYGGNEAPVAIHLEEKALNKALYNYMYGIGLDQDVRSWFDIRVPKSRVPRNFIARALTSG